MDLVLVALPSLAFGLFVTAHVRLLLGLFFRGPRLRALIALLVPLLAPFWGWHVELRGWATAWGLSAVTYALTLFLATRA